MGSGVRYRYEEACHQHECNVVLVGDENVGKSALINKFVHSKFSESQVEKLTTNAVISQRRVKFTVWDVAASQSPQRTSAYRQADVFLLCFNISDPGSLFSALNRWCPEVRAQSPSTPIILIGCQADTRTDRDRLAVLAKQGKAPISSDQALTFSQQIGALMYVETSAKARNSTANSAFEVAALASMGQLKNKNPQNNSMEKKKARMSSVIAEDLFWDRFHVSTSTSTSTSGKSAQTSTPSISSSSRSASLGSSKTSRSSASIPSITSTGAKTPKPFRRWGSRSSSSSLQQQQNKSQQQQQQQSPGTITIKCQRLTADKTYEEIEVEVPAPIYETIQLYNEASNASSLNGSLASRTRESRRSFGAKLKHLFTSRE